MCVCEREKTHTFWFLKELKLTYKKQLFSLCLSYISHSRFINCWAGVQIPIVLVSRFKVIVVSRFLSEI